MNERQPSAELCRNCPNRSRLSKVLARVAGTSELADGCEGMIKVAHGEIQTRVRLPGEPDVTKQEFDWNVLTGSRDGTRSYSRKEWTTEEVCGREPIEPREGEVPYRRGTIVWKNADGERRATFITGSEEELAEHYGEMAIMDLMDATIAMEDAEDEGDEEGAQKALDKINQYGFEKPITAGRRGSGKKS